MVCTPKGENLAINYIDHHPFPFSVWPAILCGWARSNWMAVRRTAERYRRMILLSCNLYRSHCNAERRRVVCSSVRTVNESVATVNMHAAGDHHHPTNWSAIEARAVQSQCQKTADETKPVVVGHSV